MVNTITNSNILKTANITTFSLKIIRGFINFPFTKGVCVAWFLQFSNYLDYYPIRSKAINKQGTSKMKAITTGNNAVQQKTIIWSKRTRGKVARNQTKTKQIAQVFNPNTQA